MPLFKLVVALLLPWLMGTLILAYVHARPCNEIKRNFPIYVGYGFFVGYLAQYIILRTQLALFTNINYSLVVGSMLVLTLLLAYFLGTRFRNPSVIPPKLGSQTSSLFAKGCTCLLVLWVIYHLGGAFYEVIERPLYPWDAISTWAYRAKVWFFNQQLNVFTAPGDWLNHAGASEIYTIPAFFYPKYGSVMQAWAAWSYGSWSETLINLPAYLCGPAIVLALYGQSKAANFTTPIAVFVAYLFISIPLVGTHLALGGYSDIWMSGFAGLGFVALLRGLTIKDNFNLLLAIAMLLFSAFVKNEGAIWLLMALGITWLSLAGMRAILLTLMGLCFLGALFIFGIGSVELPIMGKLGIEGDRLFLSYLGTYTLTYYPVWEAHFVSFFVMGTWNLLWLLVLSGLVLVIIPPFGREKRIAALFFLAVLASHFFIFFLTDQGRWAEQFTAINRLPLHFAPALIFAVATVWNYQYQRLSPATNQNFEINHIDANAA